MKVEVYTEDSDPKKLILRNSSYHKNAVLIGGGLFLIGLLLRTLGGYESGLMMVIGLGLVVTAAMHWISNYSNVIYLVVGETLPKSFCEVTKFGTITNNQEEEYTYLNLRTMQFGSLRTSTAMSGPCVLDMDTCRIISCDGFLIVYNKGDKIARHVPKTEVRVTRNSQRAIINDTYPVKVLQTRWRRETKTGKKTNAADNTEYAMGDYYFVIFHIKGCKALTICVNSVVDIDILALFFTGKAQNLVPPVLVNEAVLADGVGKLKKNLFPANKELPASYRLLTGALLNEVKGRDVSYFRGLLDYYLRNKSNKTETKLKAILSKITK